MCASRILAIRSVKSLPKLTPFSRPNPTPLEVPDWLLRLPDRRGWWFAWRERSGACMANSQSLPKPRGGSTAWISERASSQTACKASAVAPSCRLGGSASSQAMDALGLHRCQFGDGITPALDAAASVGWVSDARDGLVSGLGSSVTGLAFGIGHRPVADRFARRAPLRAVTPRYPIDAA